jgi:hypothetical protein
VRQMGVLEGVAGLALAERPDVVHNGRSGFALGLAEVGL